MEKEKDQVSRKRNKRRNEKIFEKRKRTMGVKKEIERMEQFWKEKIKKNRSSK